MTYMFLVSLAATIIATLLGALLNKLLEKAPHELLSFFQNFTVGGLVALTFIELFPEAIENYARAIGDNKILGAVYVALIVLLVAVVFFALHELIHKLSNHHSHDKDDNEDCHDHGHTMEVFEEKNLLLASFVFLSAIFVHNIPEGLSLGISFINANSNNVPVDGIIMSSILFIHNLLIGYLMMSSFLKCNKSYKFSLTMTLLSSLPAYVLAIVGYFVASIDISELFKGVIYSISVGSLLYVLFIELLPQTSKEYKSRFTFIYVLLGLLISGVLVFLE